MEDVYGYDRRGLDRVVSISCMITILIKNLSHLRAMIYMEYFNFIRNRIISIMKQVCFNLLGNLSSFVPIFEFDHDFTRLIDGIN